MTESTPKFSAKQECPAKGTWSDINKILDKELKATGAGDQRQLLMFVHTEAFRLKAREKFEAAGIPGLLRYIPVVARACSIPPDEFEDEGSADTPAKKVDVPGDFKQECPTTDGGKAKLPKRQVYDALVKVRASLLDYQKVVLQPRAKILGDKDEVIFE